MTSIIGLFIVLILLIGLLFGTIHIASNMEMKSADNACQDIGYNSYAQGYCYDREGSVKVVLDCDYGLFSSKCKAIEVDQ